MEGGSGSGCGCGCCSCGCLLLFIAIIVAVVMIVAFFVPMNSNYQVIDPGNFHKSYRDLSESGEIPEGEQSVMVGYELFEYSASARCSTLTELS